jgi:hypothetical protein
VEIGLAPIFMGYETIVLLLNYSTIRKRKIPLTLKKPRKVNKKIKG